MNSFNIFILVVGFLTVLASVAMPEKTSHYNDKRLDLQDRDSK